MLNNAPDDSVLLVSCCDFCIEKAAASPELNPVYLMGPEPASLLLMCGHSLCLVCLSEMVNASAVERPLLPCMYEEEEVVVAEEKKCEEKEEKEGEGKAEMKAEALPAGRKVKTVRSVYCIPADQLHDEGFPKLVLIKCCVRGCEGLAQDQEVMKAHIPRCMEDFQASFKELNDYLSYLRTYRCCDYDYIMSCNIDGEEPREAYRTMGCDHVCHDSCWAGQVNNQCGPVIDGVALKAITCNVCSEGGFTCPWWSSDQRVDKATVKAHVFTHMEIKALTLSRKSDFTIEDEERWLDCSTKYHFQTLSSCKIVPCPRCNVVYWLNEDEMRFISCANPDCRQEFCPMVRA